MTGQLSYGVYRHTKAGYSGPERRRKARRIQPDRRDMIRWEPKKGDRRQEQRRRAEDHVWDAIRSLY